MATYAARESAGRRVGRTLVLGAVGGMLAGMAMAMVEMLYGWVSEAHTVWDAPMAIWAWVFGAEHFGQPANHVWPIVLGMGAHMFNSMMVGIVFVAILSALRGAGVVGNVVLGVVYGLAIWIVMRYVVLPLNEGEGRLFTTDAVSPQWVWWVAHAALGMTAGLFFSAVRRASARETPAGELRRAA